MNFFNNEYNSIGTGTLGEEQILSRALPEIPQTNSQNSSIVNDSKLQERQLINQIFPNSTGGNKNLEISQEKAKKDNNLSMSEDQKHRNSKHSISGLDISKDDLNLVLCNFAYTLEKAGFGIEELEKNLDSLLGTESIKEEEIENESDDDGFELIEKKIKLKNEIERQEKDINELRKENNELRESVKTLGIDRTILLELIEKMIGESDINFSILSTEFDTLQT